MTRAKDQLHVIQPHRFYTGSSRRNGDRHVYAPRTRFLAEAMLGLFEKRAAGGGEITPVNVAAKLREMWM